MTIVQSNEHLPPILSCTDNHSYNKENPAHDSNSQK